MEPYVHASQLNLPISPNINLRNEATQLLLSIRCIDLKILIERKVVSAFAGVNSSGLLRGAHDAGFLVIRNTLLEEIRLSSEGDIFHDYHLENSIAR